MVMGLIGAGEERGEEALTLLLMAWLSGWWQAEHSRASGSFASPHSSQNCTMDECCIDNSFIYQIRPAPGNLSMQNTFQGANSAEVAQNCTRYVSSHSRL